MSAIYECFWMVLADNSTTTTVRHPSPEVARGEAERLAGLNPGVRFYVLQSKGHALKENPVAWHEHDEIPF